MFNKVATAAIVTVYLSMAAIAQTFDLQGHRGARGLAPENTLAGFASALSIGVSTLELDVGISRDGVVVVSHDPVLNPDITRGPDSIWLKERGPAIWSLSIEEIRTYDVGRIRPSSPYAKRFPEQIPIDGARIPTLAEVFELIRRSGNSTVRVNIEAKLDPGAPKLTADPETFARAILAVSKEYFMAERVTIQSFDWRVLQEIQRLAPDIATSYLTVRQSWRDNLKPLWTTGFDLNDYDGNVPQLIKAAGGWIWSPFHREVDARQILQAHKLGLKVIPWTVNRKSRMNQLIKMDVDDIITDYPDRLRQVLENRSIKLPSPSHIVP